MPKLIDTTIRLLSQVPLAGRVPTGDLLRVAEILDKAGFACLEVSGGGVFDAAVRRGVESPWARIRALEARTTTPLGIALRGRFLVGSKPVGPDVVRRFISSASENGIDVFRLHDPLNDVSNLREAAEAIVAAGKTFHAGLVYSSGRAGAVDTLVEQAKPIPELGASVVLINDPTDALKPHLTEEIVQRIGEATGLPVGLYVQGAAGTGLSNALVATRVGAEIVATAVYPLALTLHRVSSESLVEMLHGLGRETGIDIDRLWEADDLIDEHIGDEPVRSLTPRIAVRAAEHDLPAGLVAEIDGFLRGRAAEDRLLETLDEVRRIREEVGWPPLASPIGRIIAQQAIVNVLESRRYGFVIDHFRQLVSGGFGETPNPIDETVVRYVRLLGGDELVEDERSVEDVAAEAGALAASEEDLVLIALFGEEAKALLETIRSRHAPETSLLAGDVDASRAERIREIVEIVQESGVGEIEIEDEGMRVAVRRADENQTAGSTGAGTGEGPPVAGEPPTNGDAPVDGLLRIESPMPGVFYRAQSPGTPPFVEVGSVVAKGQTLCLIEAMKLFNELKADGDGLIRSIHVDNGQPVEYGQLLFELEPVTGPPVL
jgi:oxaloacetate decarboxylase alpha subunit